MIFHENRLLADDSHLISYLFCRKLGKVSQNVASAAVEIGALRANIPSHTTDRVRNESVLEMLM